MASRRRCWRAKRTSGLGADRGIVTPGAYGRDKQPKLPTGSDRVSRFDMDVHGEPRSDGQQEGSAYNVHFESLCYHPLLLVQPASGDCLGAKLRPGNVRQRARRWDELLLFGDRTTTGGGQTGDVSAPTSACRQARDLRGRWRSAAWTYVSSKSRRTRAWSWRSNATILFRPPGRPKRSIQLSYVRYKSFRYQLPRAGRRQGELSPRSSIHQGELFPRVGFVVPEHAA